MFSYSFTKLRKTRWLGSILQNSKVLRKSSGTEMTESLYTTDWNREKPVIDYDNISRWQRQAGEILRGGGSCK